MLALTFSDPATYDLVDEQDRISVMGLGKLAPDEPVTCLLHKPDGSPVEFTSTHTMSAEHIEWFKAGSALNLIRARQRSGGRSPRRCPRRPGRGPAGAPRGRAR